MLEPSIIWRMSMEKIFVTSDAGGLRLTVYPGDSKILIVMQLDDGVVYERSFEEPR